MYRFRFHRKDYGRQADDSRVAQIRRLDMIAPEMPREQIFTDAGRCGESYPLPTTDTRRRGLAGQGTG